MLVSYYMDLSIVTESIKINYRKFHSNILERNLHWSFWLICVFLGQGCSVHAYIPTHTSSHLFFLSLFKREHLKFSQIFRHTTNTNIKPFSNSSIHNIYYKRKGDQTKPKACWYYSLLTTPSLPFLLLLLLHCSLSLSLSLFFTLSSTTSNRTLVLLELEPPTIQTQPHKALTFVLLFCVWPNSG